METPANCRPDLVPPPRPPRRARDWPGWRVAARMSLVLALALVALFTLAVPDLGGNCCHGCEVSAISTLRNISSAQAQFRAAAAIDVDGDGIGEIGGFRELSGAAPLRGRASPLSPPVLSGAFRTVRPGGIIRRASWSFRLYTRTSDGSWVSPDVTPKVIGADAAETEFRCYAWVSHRCVAHAHRTFALNEKGGIFATDDQRYVGSSGPPADAVTSVEAGTDEMQFTGTDGNVWKRVN